MSTESGYNGWKNYETWCVSLWLSNDEGLYHDTRSITRAAAQDAADEEEDRDTLVRNLADEMREYVDNLAETTCPGCREGASFVSDLLGAALSEVDWHEIAGNLLTDFVDEVDA